jgi:hypothetical protein
MSRMLASPQKERAMKRFVYPLVILAACLPFQAQAGDQENKDIKKFVRENAQSPALLAKIQVSTQAYQTWDGVTKESKMSRVLSGLDAAQASGTAIGGAVGSRANDGDED